jgi:hypothetical protein
MAPTWQEDWETVTEGWSPFGEGADRYAAIARMFHAAHANGRLAAQEGREMTLPAPYPVGLTEST